MGCLPPSSACGFDPDCPDLLCPGRALARLHQDEGGRRVHGDDTVILRPVVRPVLRLQINERQVRARPTPLKHLPAIVGGALGLFCAGALAARFLF